jgi:hypothetical protein
VEDVPDEQPSFIPTPPAKPNKPLPVAKKPAVIPAKPFDALATISVTEFGDWLAQAKQTDALSNLFKVGRCYLLVSLNTVSSLL